MSDLVDRLRALAGEMMLPEDRRTTGDAADEIERLRKELACAEAFHRVAVNQRDEAWLRLKDYERAEGDLPPRYAREREAHARTKAELHEAYAEMHKHLPSLRVVFDREPWKRCAEWFINRATGTRA